MKQYKKKIGTVLLTSLPILVFLACGTAAETIELTDLQAGGTAYDWASDAGVEQFEETVSESAAAPATKEPEEVYVHICGEVVSPGVYQVPAGSRIYDVLLLAGGFREGAAEEAINLAEEVTDGMQVIIPSKEALQEEKEALEKQRAGMVNINTATAEELCTLPGVGESRAEDIIAYRNKHGAFETIEEIMQVSGIKEGLYEKIRSKIYIE